MKKIGLLAAIVLVSGILQNCVPPPDLEAETRKELTAAEKAKRDRDCAIALSNGWEYYKNREYPSSVRNYIKLHELGCGEEYASDVYFYFGRAYLEMSNPDSAAWAFRQGLRYLPDDKNLLSNIAYTMGKLGKIDEQIYYLELQVEVDSTNAEAYGTLVELLQRTENYDELINVLQMWLRVDPDNSRAQSDLINAYRDAGRDPLDFLRQRSEGNPKNVQWGLDYANALIEDMNYAEVFRVLERIIQQNPTARGAFKLLASTALDEGDVDRAIDALLRLFELNRTDHLVAIELSQAYLRKDLFPEAIEWAETAIRVSSNGGAALYQRGEVYFTAAEVCVSGHENGLANFNDKLVYNMAFEDYDQSVTEGYRQARNRADFLKKNLIPTKGDWFLQAPEKRNFKPAGDCYTWINRSMRRP